MKAGWLTLALLLASTCVSAQATLQSELDRVLLEERLTGIAWTLVHADGQAEIGTAGYEDGPAAVPFAPTTRFHVGSLTKTLLATGVLHLATEGRISLDAPAIRYLPELFTGERPAGFSKVTVRHLLDHTAGLNDADLWQMFSERARADAPLIAAFPEPLAQLEVRSNPGSRFSYSNAGYTLLGMIIESVVDERYETYLDRRLLTPLGMHDSTFSYTSQEGNYADPQLAWGHVDDGSRHAAQPMFLRPAGQFTTTAADLATFARFLMSDGTMDGRPFVDSRLMEARGQPQGTEAVSAGLVAGYGLGLGRRDRLGVVGYCHGGNIVGFVAMLCIYPDAQKAFAYSVNTDSETADYGRIEGLMIKAIEIAPAAPPATDPSADISAWHGRYVLSPNRFRAFEYLDTVFGAVRIAAEGDDLVMTSLQRRARRLRPVGNRRYSASDRTTASHVFFESDTGDYLMSDGFQTFRKTTLAFLLAHWVSAALGVAGVVWLALTGVVSVVRYRTRVVGQPVAPAFAAIVLLCLPIPFFFTQSFMALGDFTLASGLLAAVTLLLPMGILLTLVRTTKAWTSERKGLLTGVAAVLALQWCFALMAAGMIPFRLWA